MENLQQDYTDNTEIIKSGPLVEINQIIQNKYLVISKLGSGSFGEVYLGKDLKTEEQVAIKIELQNVQPSQLKHEADVMQQFSQYEGFPKMLWFGQDEKNQLILVMELLGQNLQQQLIKSGHRMSLKTVLMLIDQMLKRIETLHNKSQIYRDMKPENWMMGSGKSMNTVYLIDYGLVKRYKNLKNKHIDYRENRGLIGTARFVSINTHMGIEQSRRDDLESLGYIWIYLLKGRLPWQGLVADTKEEKYEKLKQKKLQVTTEQLCSKLPSEFLKYIKYCRSLKFEEQPDYGELKKMFKELFFRYYINWDFIWDWLKFSENEQIKSCDCDSQVCHICNQQNQNLAVFSSANELGIQSESDFKGEQLFNSQNYNDSQFSYGIDSANKQQITYFNSNNNVNDSNQKQNQVQLQKMMSSNKKSIFSSNQLFSGKENAINSINNSKENSPIKSKQSNSIIDDNQDQKLQDKEKGEQISTDVIKKINFSINDAIIQKKQNQDYIQENLENQNNNKKNINAIDFKIQKVLSEDVANNSDNPGSCNKTIQQQQQQQQQIKFKICSPLDNQNSQVNLLEKYKNQSGNLFQSIFNTQNQNPAKEEINNTENNENQPNLINNNNNVNNQPNSQISTQIKKPNFSFSFNKANIAVSVNDNNSKNVQ